MRSMDTLVREASKAEAEDVLHSHKQVPSNSNVIHMAVKKNQYTSVSKALDELSPEKVIELLCQTDTLEGSNPLHYAAKEGNIFTVKLLVNAYVRAATDVGYQGIPPWLTKNFIGNTPVRSCFVKKTIKSHESVARYLILRDHELFRTLGEQRYLNLCSPEKSSTMALDKTGASILFCAMQEGFSLLAEQIITSGLPYSLTGKFGENPLGHASKCNEQVCRLLLEKHPELISKEPGLVGTVLDRAVEDNATWLVKLMLIEEKASIQCSPQPWTKACRRLIWHTNSTSSGDTPLHIAARKGNVDIAKLLLQGYESATQDEAEEWDVAQAHPANDNLGVMPLHIENLQGNIPLFVALKNKRDDLGVYLLSAETVLIMWQRMDGKGKYAYEIAVENGCEQSRKMMFERTVVQKAELLNSAPNVKDIHPSVLKIVRHIASRYPAMSEKLTSVDEARLFLEGLPLFGREPNKDATSHLEEAAERGADWLVKLLLEGDTSLINVSTPAWIKACEKGHLSTLLAFIEKCDNQEFISVCQKDRQTPLHHIKLPQYEQYKKLLSNPVMQDLINELDPGGATPLHRAIKRNDYGLSKALFEADGIKLDIEDLNHKTALGLLEDRCSNNDSFFRLYKGLLENPLMTQDFKNMIDNYGATPLHRAIEQNVRRLVKTLVETKGLKLEIKDYNGNTSLALIEERCRLKYADSFWYDLYKTVVASPEMLHKMKNHRGSSGATPMHIAIEWNDLDLARTLVHTKGIKLDISDTNGKTAIDVVEELCDPFDSLWYGWYKELLGNPVMTLELKNRVDSNGATSLHRAIQQVAKRLVKLLMETKGVKCEIKDYNGKTALDLIEERCSSTDGFWFEQYRELLANADMLQKLKNHIGSSGATPLHIAIEKDALKLAKTLVETKGIDLNITDTNGKTAIDLIEERCDPSHSWWYEWYKELLANAVMTNELKNRADSNGATSLHRAIERDAKRVVKLLMETKGVNFHIKDCNGKTALDLIEERCKFASIDVFWFKQYKELFVNAEMLQKLKNHRGSSGATPLHKALEWEDLDLARTLVQTKGIKLDITDTNGKTAIDVIEELCKPSNSLWYEWYKDLLANSVMTNELINRVDSNGATSLHRAIERDDKMVVLLLMNTKAVKWQIKDCNVGKTALDLIEERCKCSSTDSFWFERYRELFANAEMLQKLKNHRGSSGATPLHIAIEWEDADLVRILVQSKGIDLSIKNTIGKTALDLVEEKCNKYDTYDSPWYEMYKDLFDNPHYVHELKNHRVGIDNSETPLHRAIRLDDTKLAKTLLETKGVELDIEDKDGNTALDLLEGLYKSGKWGDMCREIRLDPSIKIFKFKYFQRRTSLMHMQETLSVVAALLATITFAAGIAVPGGADETYGTAILAREAGFLVFTVANTLAMCSSIVVLFTVIGAMIWEAHPKATSSTYVCSCCSSLWVVQLWHS